MKFTVKNFSETVMLLQKFLLPFQIQNLSFSKLKDQKFFIGGDFLDI